MKLKTYLIGIIIGLMPVFTFVSCTEDSLSEIAKQPNEGQITDDVARVKNELKTMPYYGQNPQTSRALIDKEELVFLFKIIIADLYGYLSSNSETKEGRAIDCIKTSAAMVMHIVNETTKEVMPDDELKFLSKYMRNNSKDISDLVISTKSVNFEDSIGYYHNLTLANSNIMFCVSEKLNIDSINIKVEAILPTRLSGIVNRTKFLKEFINSKIPAIYEAKNIHAAIDVFAYDKMLPKDFNEIYEPFITGLYKSNGFLDIRNYRNSLNIILKSDLDLDTKRAMENAIIITYASAKLWDPSSFNKTGL